MGNEPLFPSGLSEDQRIRQVALQLAVETVRTVRSFTNYTVIHTAVSYENYIRDGSTPPAPQAVPAPEPDSPRPALFIDKDVLVDEEDGDG